MTIRNCLVCNEAFNDRHGHTLYCSKHTNYRPTNRSGFTHGVAVLQPGCACWDHYSRGSFAYWVEVKAFPKGTMYRVDGVERTI